MLIVKQFVLENMGFPCQNCLNIKTEENLKNIKETKHFVKNKKEFLFDAEHFLMDTRIILIMLLIA